MSRQATETATTTNDAAPPAAEAGRDVTGRVDVSPLTLWEKVDNLVDGFVALLPNLVIGVVLFAIFFFAARLVRGFIRRRTASGERANLGVVVGRLSQVAILGAGLLIAVSIIAPSVKPVDLLGLLGVSGVAIGFAFKDILQNLLAGILILIQEPFRVGDDIEAGDHVGTVESIETRATWLKTFDGKRVIIPNADIYTEAVVVHTAHDRIRSQFTVGIGYDEDLREARERIVEACRGVDGVLDDPAPQAIVWELGGSTVDLRVRYWTDPRSTTGTRDRVVAAVKEGLDAAGIEMPFPTRDLNVRGGSVAADSEDGTARAADQGRGRAARDEEPAEAPGRSQGGARPASRLSRGGAR